jgi:hypothetical protein
MRALAALRVLPLILAATFLVPKPALAIDPFEPFAEEMDNLVAAFQQVIDETPGMVSVFSGNKKVVKQLEGASKDASKALDILENKDWPKSLKKAGGKAKKMAGRWNKAVKASDNDSLLLDSVTTWSVALLVALTAIITLALSLSLNWFGDFKKSTEKKHIKTDRKFQAALVLMGMSGFFNPLIFAWGSNTKKAFSLTVAALGLSLVLILFIAAHQT